jgi:hypothetical protein
MSWGAPCNKCGEVVRWCETAMGRSILMDTKTKPTGKYVVLVGGVVRIVTDEDKRLHRERYDCHWDVCTG